MKRTDWLIAGFLAVLFLFVAGGVMVFWLQSQAYANLPTETSAATSAQQQNSAGEGLTAKNAFLAADTLAKQWQPDAEIVSASAAIVQFDTIEDRYNGKGNWTVVYYSPIAGAVANYTVTDSGASFLNAKAINIDLVSIDLEKISLDSNQAMTLAVSNGADSLFKGEADRIASIKLEHSQQTGRPEWRIFIQNETSSASMNFQIDAETGEIRQ